MEKLEEENSLLREEVKKLQAELEDTKQHLKRYTAPPSSRVYYQRHKEEVKERVKECRKKNGYKSTPEQRQEYNKRSYLKRKEKQQEKKIAENIEE